MSFWRAELVWLSSKIHPSWVSPIDERGLEVAETLVVMVHHPPVEVGGLLDLVHLDFVPGYFWVDDHGCLGC